MLLSPNPAQKYRRTAAAFPRGVTRVVPPRLRCPAMHLQRRSLLGLPFALVLVTAPRSALAQPTKLTVAAASDLRFALDDLLQAFRATRPGVDVDVVYGSSGKLSTQIRNGDRKSVV